VRRFIKGTATTIAVGAGLAGAVDAAEILVTSDISTSTTWTADNTYNLQDQIYVLPGATLTIEAGTVVASTTDLGGSLAVCRGAMLFVQGTQAEPVIMTSTADVATWTGGDPKTGTWREEANEWGNLTIMGEAYVSENAAALGNSSVPDAGNEADMEGLVNGPSTDRYGGGDDDDDSGTIEYLSIRYGGKVISLNNELNGLSLGGIGRETDIRYVEVQNNVDDGIEIWGGTVNLKYVCISDVGDDSFDIDQGWRGKAQFGLIIQGYSLDAAQGSGVGDNCFETDGAENSDWQPVTTATIYNFTVIGQPIDGDHGTAWRDGARVQYRNCIFMDVGEQVVKNDNVDGDGGSGYGFSGTLSFADVWDTDYDMVPAHANDFITGSYATNYAAQSSGKLAEIKDSVFFRNQHASAYTEATTQGVFDAGNNNVTIPGIDDADSPLTLLTRDSAVSKGGKMMVRVLSIDPRPANEAVTSVASAPNDGFFMPAMYRGAFESGKANWLWGWTALDAFGRVVQPVASATSRNGGTNPVSYTATTLPVIGGTYTASIDLAGTTGHTFAYLVGFATPLTFTLGGGQTILVNVADPGGELLAQAPDAGPIAVFNLAIPNDVTLSGLAVSTQAIHLFGVQPFKLSNAQDLCLGY
jgi:hypothetical protein